MKDLFDVNKFNIIEDEENYYFFRALNMADNADIEQQTTISTNGKIERIRTDRERFEGETKYAEDSEISLEEIYDHIKMHYRKDTNCISLTSNANIAVNYGRGFYKDRYVMIKVPKKEFGERVVSAGQYMLKELYSRITQAIEKLPEEKKQEILEFFVQIENAKENKSLQDIITQRYTARSGEANLDKAHLRKGIKYSSPKARISSYQSLDEEQLLEVNKVYAKLAVLENEHILEHVIPHSSNSKLRETIGNAFSSAEVIHYGDISEESILEIPKEVVDIFALVQQVNGIDKNKLEELKQALIIAVQSGKQIPQIPEIDSKVKDNISIEEMYELTEGKVEYGKANSIVRNMFYLSKSRQNAIALSNALSEILGNDSRFEEIIQYIRENGFRVEPEIISRKSGKGVKLSESVNLNLQKEEQSLVDEIRKLSSEELNIVLQNGGLYNAGDIITTTFGNIRESEKIDKSRYYAEAIIAGYNWQNIGIEEFKVSERNELIKRLQERNCVEIYERLKRHGIEESQIPTILLNIATREGFYEQYVQGNLEQLLNTRQDVLQNNINIEVVERFLGYYDVENTGIRLKDYQQRAYDNINKIFEEKKFAQVILPTGAGKSFVALAQMQKYAQEHPNEKMLYLAPQDEILNQIKSYIVKYVHGKQGTVGKTDDEIIAEVFPNITFETYSGLLAKRGQEVIKDQYGMIVLDELHRTGAKEWEGKIDKLLENQTDDVKVLGITATPTRDVDGRDMANETAKKLGYTDAEISRRKHLASNMTLENAIRMGYVVNPKLVYCKYDLISSGKMNELRAKIDDIEDENKRAEELQKYNELRQKLNTEIDSEIGEEARKKLEEEARKNLDSGIGKEEILRQNVKKGGKYIVFIPVTDQGDIEDENGNRIGTKTGEDKINAYQDYLNKMFEGTDIVPQLHSLLGSYSKDKNKEELEAFESNNSEKTKFMVVMNKANEGLHIDGVDGIIWFRALDENSRILYLQQLGRAIYALDEDNPLPDDKRPVVIDLANNSLTVKIEKEFENVEPLDDLEALTIVIEWIEQHNGMLPNRNSSNKQEQHYYAVIRRIQNKYSKYLDGFDNFEDLTEEDKSRIQEIIEMATRIDLWNIDLPPIPKVRGGKEEVDPFEIIGVLRDYVEIQYEIDNIERKTIYEQVIGFLENHDGKFMRTSIRRDGQYLKVNEMSKEEQEEVNLYARWRYSKEKEILEEYAGQPIENVPEEYRDKIAKLREYGLGEKVKTTYEEVIEFLETHDGRLMRSSKIKINGKYLYRYEMTKEKQEELKLYARWRRSKEKEILEEYAGQPIENVPEEYRDKIAKLREFGLGKYAKTTYEEVIEFLETHDGRMMRSNIRKNRRDITRDEMTEEEQKEVNLYQKWNKSEERIILEEYAGQPIENVPEEYRDKIATLREFGLGKYAKTTYEEVIEFLETHDGRMMRGSIRKNRRDEMTEEEQKEVNLYQKWNKSEERIILEEYAGQPIENVPEGYRDKIATLREYGLGDKVKTTYEQVVEFLETHDGSLMRSTININGKIVSTNEMTEEEQEEVNLYARWRHSKEKEILEEYAGQPIENVPEEYRDKIAKLREYGLGEKVKTTYEEVIEFLQTHDGRVMRSNISRDGKRLKVNETTEEEQAEFNLYSRWRYSKEKEILEEYAGQPIEKVPEEYRDKIAILRGFGLGEKEKTTYEKVIEFLETHNGRLMRRCFRRDGKNLKRNEMTEEEQEEAKLQDSWLISKERKILEEYAGQPIENVPEEYRDKIATLRAYGLGEKEKTTYERVIEFLETHDGRLMKSNTTKDGRDVKRCEMTKERIEELNLYARWSYSKEKEILEEYAGQPIENVPEEYRDKIATLRGFGLGNKEKDIYEQVIEFLETHESKMMRGNIARGGKSLKRNEMTEEEQEELKLYQRWNRSKERKILEEYAGQSIENVPEEYRDKIEKLRTYGLGKKEKTTYEEVIEFLETHGGKVMRSNISRNGKKLKANEITEEEQAELNLSSRWRYSKEKEILEEYAGQPIENVPEDYKDKIAKLREYGLGEKVKTTYEEVIEFLQTHDGRVMRSNVTRDGKRLKANEITEEEQAELNLSSRWRYSKEKEILEEYAGQPIENVPEEYRDKIAKLREFGLGEKEKTIYEQVLQFLETHEGKIMRGRIAQDGKNLKRDEMTEEEQEEINLYQRWNRAEERKILEEYAGQPIENVPEEYRDKIATLREFGLGTKKSKLKQAKQQRDEAKSRNNQAKELEQQVSEQLKKRGQTHDEQ